MEMLESLEKETGNKDSKWATNQSSKEQLQSIEALSESIVSDSDIELDLQEVRNSLIDIINSNDVVDSVMIKVPKTYPAYFGTYNQFDEIAFNNLKENQIEKAIEIWDKTLKEEITSKNYAV